MGLFISAVSLIHPRLITATGGTVTLAGRTTCHQLGLLVVPVVLLVIIFAPEAKLLGVWPLRSQGIHPVAHLLKYSSLLRISLLCAIAPPSTTPSHHFTSILSHLKASPKLHSKPHAKPIRPLRTVLGKLHRDGLPDASTNGDAQPAVEQITFRFCRNW